MNGTFAISLDVELVWGVRDTMPEAKYAENLYGERAATAAIIDLFAEYKIHATWAIVGFLFFSQKRDLLCQIPACVPKYDDQRLCPYRDLESLGNDESADPLHLGASLVRMIAAGKSQEIGTHTFSHYYCLEDGQNFESFRADLAAAVAIAEHDGLRLHSIVFPRNQVNPEYLAACREVGLRAYRGTERHWLYRPRRWREESLLRRGLRLVDAYISLTGDHTTPVTACGIGTPINLAQSRFLRPYSHRLSIFEPLRLRRIVKSLDAAARKGELYHLWWHPHNFGVNLDKNIAFLRRVLDHFAELHARYGMESLNMREIAERFCPDPNTPAD